jgi:hypothetical protein
MTFRVFRESAPARNDFRARFDVFDIEAKFGRGCLSSAWQIDRQKPEKC